MRTIYALIRYFNSTRFWAPLGATAILATATVAWAVAPTGIFELDGNTTVDSFGGCDWNPLNSGKTADSTTPTAPCAEAGATLSAYGFLEGGPGEPNFTTGGSKDPLDVTDWQFTTGSTPDKDTLTHGYAAAYSAGGDTILVFGAERFAVNGDSNIGIWFFQSTVGIPTGVSKGSFTGTHTPGDILIVSAFTGGGGTSTISVYQWNPTACPASNYPNISGSGQLSPPLCAATNLLALFIDTTVGSTAICTSSSPACALVNSAPITIGWPYTAKFGIGSNTVPTGGFYEGGIDLTVLLPSGTAAPCFSSFLFETRSSQSTSAVLKDFLVGSFPQCHMSISKTYTCNSFNSDGTFNYSYTGSLINDGGGELFNVQAVDNGVTYNCNGPLAAGATVTFPSTACPQPSGTTNSKTTSAHPDTNMATGSAQTSSSGGTTITAATGSVTSTDASATSCSPVARLEVTKLCVTNFEIVGSNVVVRVDYTGVVTNSGNDNLSNVRVADSASGTGDTAPYGPLTLSPGESKCFTNSGATATCPPVSPVPGLTPPAAGTGHYYPSGANILALTAGRIEFSDTVSATGMDAFGHSVGPVTASAQCHICPAGQCSTTTQ
jgi:hypothetical protein